mmetsp:Transcript_29077/g.72512  ORF Transcript_29077/g.72512 Transcript_29077/m.72512 type:complete len:256 (+) Transcript_29077:135-902(+)
MTSISALSSIIQNHQSYVYTALTCAGALRLKPVRAFRLEPLASAPSPPRRAAPSTRRLHPLARPGANLPDGLRRTVASIKHCLSSLSPTRRPPRCRSAAIGALAPWVRAAVAPALPQRHRVPAVPHERRARLRHAAHRGRAVAEGSAVPHAALRERIPLGGALRVLRIERPQVVSHQPPFLIALHPVAVHHVRVPLALGLSVLPPDLAVGELAHVELLHEQRHRAVVPAERAAERVLLLECLALRLPHQIGSPRG